VNSGILRYGKYEHRLPNALGQIGWRIERLKFFFTAVGCEEWILGGEGARERERERERAEGVWKGGAMGR